MTDYGQFYDSDGYLKQYEEDSKMTKPKNPILKCSKNKDLTTFLSLTKDLIKLSKKASSAGFCLDELIDAVRIMEKQ